ncbi:MAG: hypothetical protein Q8K32_24585 [Archangium sp.]|nr:hypothetical protein [Archangium sp.]
MPPSSRRTETRFDATWGEFSTLRLWEQWPAELSVRVRRKRAEHAIAFIPEGGFVFYEDPRAFEAMWSGEAFPIEGLSVVEGQLIRIVASTPKPPRVQDFVLATAAMRVLINLVTGERGPVSLGRGEKLELKR